MEYSFLTIQDKLDKLNPITFTLHTGHHQGKYLSWDRGRRSPYPSLIAPCLVVRGCLLLDYPVSYWYSLGFSQLPPVFLVLGTALAHGQCFYLICIFLRQITGSLGLKATRSLGNPVSPVSQWSKGPANSQSLKTRLSLCYCSTRSCLRQDPELQGTFCNLPEPLMEKWAHLFPTQWVVGAFLWDFLDLLYCS